MYDQKTFTNEAVVLLWKEANIILCSAVSRGCKHIPCSDTHTVLLPCFLNGRFAGWEDTRSSSHRSRQTVLPGMALACTSRSHTAAGAEQDPWGDPGGAGPFAPAKPLSSSFCCHFICLIFLLLDNLSACLSTFIRVGLESCPAPAQPAAQVLSRETFSRTVPFPHSYLISPGYPALAVLHSSGCPPHPPPRRGCSWAGSLTATQALSTLQKNLALAFSCLPFPFLASLLLWF